MPHHSAQKRQMTSFAGSAPPPPPPLLSGSASFPSSSSRSELDYRMVPPHAQQGVLAVPPHHHPHHHAPYPHQHPHPHSPFHQHPSMRPHPPVTLASSWTSSPAGSASAAAGVVHRVDLHADDRSPHHHRGEAPSSASAGSSRGGSSSHDEGAAGGGTTPRLLPSYDNDDTNNAGSRSFDSPHEVAASVLLLAATAMKERDSQNEAATEKEDANPSEGAGGGGPDPKKRKTTTQGVAGIMRKKSGPDAVSPYSHGSSGKVHSTNGDDAPTTSGGTEATTPLTDRGGGGTTTGGSSPTSSYDLKDGQALHDSAKITDTKHIMTPPTHVEIPHFPSVLHAVLTESEFAGTVLLWLPHGQAWKIVRWDALRRQVLPKYFAQLREEDSKDASGSIDAFLWHLAAWGFEEVTDGPDAGAYSHILFRRELPGLCREMRFSPSEPEVADNLPDKDRGDGARYILQVPSLASTGMASDHSGRSAPDEEKKEDYSSYPNQVTPVWPKRSQVSLGYSSSDPHASSAMGAWKYYPEPSPQWIGGTVVGGATATSSPTSSIRSMPPYSPIRVRSGRGACRLPLNRSRSSQDAPISSSSQEPPQLTAAARCTFPVSNRGKGSRAAPRRLSLPTTASGASVSSSATTTNAEIVVVAKTTADPAPHVPSSPQQQQQPPPRPILKRKLPLMRKTSLSDDGSSSSGSSTTSQGDEARRKSPSERDSAAAVVDADEPAEEQERDDSPALPTHAEVTAV